MLVVKSLREYITVSRIRYTSRANTEIFTLHILHMNGSFASFEDPKRVGSESFLTYRDTAISGRLYTY